MGTFSIAAYRPKPGKAPLLLQVVRDHMPVLRAESLVTDRPAQVMRAEDGTIVEVFEWKSDAAIEQAHSNPQVQKLWTRFGEACNYVPLGALPECKEMFANFEPIDL